MNRSNALRMPNRRAGAIVVICAAAILGRARSSTAATVDNWNVNSGGSWNTAANWSTGSIPTIANDATIGSIATSVTSPATITLDAMQIAYGLTLDPSGAKSIHIDTGAVADNKLTLLSTDTSQDGVNKFFTINAASGNGNQINAPIALGGTPKGFFTAIINSFDPNFAINGSISELVPTWGVKIIGKGGIVSYATTPSTYRGDTTVAGNGVLRIDLNNAIPNGTDKGNVVLEDSGQLQFYNATTQTINGLNSTSSSVVVTNIPANNGVTLTIGGANASGSYAGSINNPSGTGAFNIVKTGGGTQRLFGANTYRGTTFVSAGTLLVNGTHTNASSYSTAANATLGGTGTINLAGTSSVQVNTGFLSPGDGGPGVLNVNGTLSMSSIGTLRIELGGAFPGNGSLFYDQVNMTNPTATIITSFAHISASLVNDFKPKPTDIFYILTRADSAAFAGTQPFDARPEGSTITLGNGFSGKITYKASWTGNQATSTVIGGNDMAIFNVIPEPTTATLLTLATLALIACHRPAKLRTRVAPTIGCTRYLL